MSLVEVVRERQEALRAQDLAQLLGVSPQQIYKMAAKGEIPSFKVANDFLTHFSVRAKLQLKWEALMDSFVFTRHSSDYKFKRDRFCSRCNCPKWVEGRFNHERFRKSASTRVWDEAEQFREKLEEALSRGLPLDGLHADSIAAPATPPSALRASAAQAESTATASVPISPGPAAAPPEVNASSTSQSGAQSTSRQKARVTVQKAVDAYMTDARSRGLKSDTIKKLERIFEKQFLPWTRAQGHEYLDEVDLDALLAFRSTWTEGAIVRAKKQDRVIGFFWDCFRRNYVTQNPALLLSKIKTTPVPTDGLRLQRR